MVDMLVSSVIAGGDQFLKYFLQEHSLAINTYDWLHDVQDLSMKLPTRENVAQIITE